MNNELEKVSPDCVPFQMLTPFQQEVIKDLSEGLRNTDIASQMGWSVPTIDLCVERMGAMGLEDGKKIKQSKLSSRLVNLVLVQDGVLHGYLPKPIKEGEDFLPLTAREEEIMQSIRSGETTWEITKRLRIVTKTLDAHKANIRKKLRLRLGQSFYLAVARHTYLEAKALEKTNGFQSDISTKAEETDRNDELIGSYEFST
jgi:DNA-binding NarL/FixJ family response regulator